MTLTGVIYVHLIEEEFFRLTSWSTLLENQGMFAGEKICLQQYIFTFSVIQNEMCGNGSSRMI